MKYRDIFNKYRNQVFSIEYSLKGGVFHVSNVINDEQFRWKLTEVGDDYVLFSLRIEGTEYDIISKSSVPTEVTSQYIPISRIRLLIEEQEEFISKK